MFYFISFRPSPLVISWRCSILFPSDPVPSSSAGDVLFYFLQTQSPRHQLAMFYFISLRPSPLVISWRRCSILFPSDPVPSSSAGDVLFYFLQTQSPRHQLAAMFYFISFRPSPLVISWRRCSILFPSDPVPSSSAGDVLFYFLQTQSPRHQLAAMFYFISFRPSPLVISWRCSILFPSDPVPSSSAGDVLFYFLQTQSPRHQLAMFYFISFRPSPLVISWRCSILFPSDPVPSSSAGGDVLFYFLQTQSPSHQLAAMFYFISFRPSPLVISWRCSILFPSDPVPSSSAGGDVLFYFLQTQSPRHQLAMFYFISFRPSPLVISWRCSILFPSDPVPSSSAGDVLFYFLQTQSPRHQLAMFYFISFRPSPLVISWRCSILFPSDPVPSSSAGDVLFYFLQTQSPRHQLAMFYFISFRPSPLVISWRCSILFPSDPVPSSSAGDVLFYFLQTQSPRHQLAMFYFISFRPSPLVISWRCSILFPSDPVPSSSAGDVLFYFLQTQSPHHQLAMFYFISFRPSPLVISWRRCSILFPSDPVPSSSAGDVLFYFLQTQSPRHQLAMFYFISFRPSPLVISWRCSIFNTKINSKKKKK
ncbi:hypothetical protein BgiMline_015653 [Biomphalaria glabrata]|nr:hypothetical protein BgiMline_008471 [Biomphalaria glabrata]